MGETMNFLELKLEISFSSFTLFKKKIIDLEFLIN